MSVVEMWKKRKKNAQPAATLYAWDALRGGSARPVGALETLYLKAFESSALVVPDLALSIMVASKAMRSKLLGISRSKDHVIARVFAASSYLNEASSIDATIYSSSVPCEFCSEMIAWAGVGRIYCIGGSDAKFSEGAKELLAEADVEVWFT